MLYVVEQSNAMFHSRLYCAAYPMVDTGRCFPTEWDDHAADMRHMVRVLRITRKDMPEKDALPYIKCIHEHNSDMLNWLLAKFPPSRHVIRACLRTCDKINMFDVMWMLWKRYGLVGYSLARFLEAVRTLGTQAQLDEASAALE